jgi:hypothetical protein
MIAIPVPSRRPVPDPADRMATAHHEAGHAVVALINIKDDLLVTT